MSWMLRPDACDSASHDTGQLRVSGQSCSEAWALRVLFEGGGEWEELDALMLDAVPLPSLPLPCTLHLRLSLYIEQLFVCSSDSLPKHVVKFWFGAGPSYKSTVWLNHHTVFS